MNSKPHYFLEGIVFVYPYEGHPDGLDWLTPDQESFLEQHPGAKAHEVRACLLDVDKPLDMVALKQQAKQHINQVFASMLLTVDDDRPLLAARTQAMQAIDDATSPDTINHITSTFGHEQAVL